MVTIGVLLPGSLLYPRIGIDFINGFKLSFSFHKQGDCNLVFASIGNGSKETEVFAEVEKMLISHDPEIIVLYTNDWISERLAPLFIGANRLLIIINSGANYSPALHAEADVLFHSFNDNLCCFLTGKKAATSEGKNGLMATSFYDGGYSHFHAMSNAFTQAGGLIKYNLIIPLDQEDAQWDKLMAFLKEHPDTKKIMSIFSANMKQAFYEKLNADTNNSDLEFFGSPMMFDQSQFPIANTTTIPIKGFTYWLPHLQNEENLALHNTCKKEKKQVGLFTMQGWESALLVIQYLKEKVHGTVNETIYQLKQKKLETPRGTVSITKNNMILGPAYFVSDSGSGSTELLMDESISDPTPQFIEMMSEVPESPGSGWKNTYLCT